LALAFLLRFPLREAFFLRTSSVTPVGDGMEGKWPLHAFLSSRIGVISSRKVLSGTQRCF
jgi:hypothetical protein